MMMMLTQRQRQTTSKFRLNYVITIIHPSIHPFYSKYFSIIIVIVLRWFIIYNLILFGMEINNKKKNENKNKYDDTTKDKGYNFFIILYPQSVSSSSSPGNKIIFDIRLFCFISLTHSVFADYIKIVVSAYFLSVGLVISPSSSYYAISNNIPFFFCKRIENKEFMRLVKWFICMQFSRIQYTNRLIQFVQYFFFLNFKQKRD